MSFYIKILYKQSFSSQAARPLLLDSLELYPFPHLCHYSWLFLQQNSSVSFVYWHSSLCKFMPEKASSSAKFQAPAATTMFKWHPTTKSNKAWASNSKSRRALSPRPKRRQHSTNNKSRLSSQRLKTATGCTAKKIMIDLEWIKNV